MGLGKATVTVRLEYGSSSSAAEKEIDALHDLAFDPKHINDLITSLFYTAGAEFVRSPVDASDRRSE